MFSDFMQYFTSLKRGSRFLMFPGVYTWMILDVLWYCLRCIWSYNNHIYCLVCQGDVFLCGT